jgi:hypothetical protein
MHCDEIVPLEPPPASGSITHNPVMLGVIHVTMSTRAEPDVRCALHLCCRAWPSLPPTPRRNCGAPGPP